MSVSSLRILIVHNRYRLPGGEDVVAEAQTRLLRERGHDVRVFEKDNREIDTYGLMRRAALFFKTTDNQTSAGEIAKIAHEFKPQVAHVHNTLPLLSPSVYLPLRKAGAKVIQYLHNYRLVCPAGTLYRDGAQCTLCVDDDLKHAVKYRCWTGSMPATLAVTRMLERHRRKRTWQSQINLIVALNSYQRELLLKKNLADPENIVVQPNFISVPNDSVSENAGDGFLFAGRLVPEKGVATLFKAHAQVPSLELKILGDGPLKNTAKDHAPTLTFEGQRPREALFQLLAASRALVFSSEWHEGCPSIILEAMALGRPVIAAKMAGATGLIRDGENGLLYEPGNATELAQRMQYLQENPAKARQMGAAARTKYLTDYSVEAGYKRMMENYQRIGVT